MAAAEAKAATPAAPSQHRKPPLFWQNPIRCGGWRWAGCQCCCPRLLPPSLQAYWRLRNTSCLQILPAVVAEHAACRHEACRHAEGAICMCTSCGACTRHGAFWYSDVSASTVTPLTFPPASSLSCPPPTFAAHRCPCPCAPAATCCTCGTRRCCAWASAARCSMRTCLPRPTPCSPPTCSRALPPSLSGRSTWQRKGGRRWAGSTPSRWCMQMLGGRVRLLLCCVLVHAVSGSGARLLATAQPGLRGPPRAAGLYVHVDV